MERPTVPDKAKNSYCILYSNESSPQKIACNTRTKKAIISFYQFLVACAVCCSFEMCGSTFSVHLHFMESVNSLRISHRLRDDFLGVIALHERKAWH